MTPTPTTEDILSQIVAKVAGLAEKHWGPCPDPDSDRIKTKLPVATMTDKRRVREYLRENPEARTSVVARLFKVSKGTVYEARADLGIASPYGQDPLKHRIIALSKAHPRMTLAEIAERTGASYSHVKGVMAEYRRRKS